MCSAYSRLAALGLPPEEQTQLRFLLHALALRHAGTPDAERRFRALSELVGDATEAERAVAARLSPALAEVLKGVEGAGALMWSVEELATLLRKEQLNSYGILASHQQSAAAARAEAQQHASGSGAGGVRGDGEPAGAAGAEGGCAGGSWQAASSSGAAAGAGCSRARGGRGAALGEAEVLPVEDGERRLRGSALYWQASLINHECLPNVARYDFFDSRRPDSTHINFRALHDLPAGTELAQSYMPLHWSLQERQAQCRDVYGFSCTCPRCQTESQWSDEEEGEESEWETDSGHGDMEEEEAAEGEGQAAAASTSGGAVDGPAGSAGAGEEEVEMQDVQAPIHAPPGEEGPLESAYLRLFLLKYMCARPGCFGTAAPEEPGSTMLECNVCGRARSEREFLRDLEKSHHQHQQRNR